MPYKSWSGQQYCSYYKQYAIQQDMMKCTRHVPSIIVNIKKFVLDNHSWAAKRKKIEKGANDV